MEIAVAVIIFVVTMAIVIWQPKDLGIGWPAIGGAIITLLVGYVSLHDVMEVISIVWNATLAFIAIIIICLVLNEIGFFEWAALWMIRLSKGNCSLLFIYVIILGAIVSALFANDGAALILTPIILAKVRILKLNSKQLLPFIMAGGFIADTASLPFVTSNLVNILSADFYGIGFGEYALYMSIPFLASTFISGLVLWLYFYRSLPKCYDCSYSVEPQTVIKDQLLFNLSWWILLLLFIGCFVSGWQHFPVSFIIIPFAVLFLLMAQKRKVIHSIAILKQSPWAIIFFSLGMYIVVYALRNVGLAKILSLLLELFISQGQFVATIGMGCTSAILSCIFNNLPAVMLDLLAIQHLAADAVMQKVLVLSSIIGADVGPKMIPTGSLATLLWLHVLKKHNVAISWGYYIKVGVILTIPTLLFVLLSLYGWLKLLA